MRFYLEDIRAMPLGSCGAKRLCLPGCRKFCERHGWDWNDFLDNGRLVSDLRAVDDAMATRVADFVERWRAK